MSAAATATAWFLWRRHRWPALALFALGACLALYAQATAPAPPATRLSLFLLSLPLLFGLLYGMAAFSYPEGDIMTAQSGFPRYMLVLPARTWELVFWPMLYGTVTLALAWTGLFRLILMPAGVSPSAWWQAALFAALLASLQALSWSPMGLPYLRVVLALLLFPALVSAGVLSWVNGASPWLLTASYLGLILLAYGAALAGLSRARRGEEPVQVFGRSGVQVFRRVGAASLCAQPLPTAAPFTSSEQAQLWLEWRRNGIVLPLLVGSMGLFTLPLLAMGDRVPLGPGGMIPLPHLQDLELNLWVKLLQGALIWPVFLAAIAGCGMRRSEPRRKDLSLPPFLSTRPLTSTALVAAKLKMAALSTLAAWAVMLFFLTLWLLTPARHGDRSGPLLFLLLPHITPKTWLLFLTTLPLLALWTWKNQVQSLCVDLTGRWWIVTGFPVVFYGLALAALVLFTQRTSASQEMDAHYYPVAGYVPWLVALTVALKATGSAWALRELSRRRLVERRTLAALLTVWAVVAMALFAWLSAVTRAGLLGGLPLPAGLLARPYLAAAAALFLPLTRLALAPLALEWNRHRE
jgi:hypothetical protein